MAVVRVSELPKLESTRNERWKRTYTRVFEVETDDNGDGPAIVRAAPGLPTFGIYYAMGNEQDTASFFQSDRISMADRKTTGGAFWEVVCEYGPYDPTQFSQNPIEWPATVEFDSAQFTRAQGFTTPYPTGNSTFPVAVSPIVNSAGDPFDEPVEVDDSRILLRVTRNEESFDPIFAYNCKDSVNASQWGPFPEQTAKVMSIRGRAKFDQDSGTPTGFYFEVSYEFAIDPNGWRKEILDQGLAVLDGSSKLVALTGDDGKPITEPVLLDGTGKQLTHGSDPVFLSFQVYPELDFSVFNIDLTGLPGLGG